MRQRQNDGQFLKQLNRHTPAQGDINNTPLRPRNNKENTMFSGSNARQAEKDNSANGSQTNTNKTVAKKRTVTQSACVNHAESSAEFRIAIDNEILDYCNKCAAHLASNGFTVERIGQTRSPLRQKDIRSTLSKRKNQLNVFLSSLNHLEKGYFDKEEHLRRVQGSHSIEKQTIGNFYASMLQYVEYIREQHLHFLTEEANRHTQICEIQAAEIVDTLEQIVSMREDMEGNINKIVEEVQEESYTQCMNYYAQKRRVHEHRLEELGVQCRAAPCTSDECIQQKLCQFKNFMEQITGIRNDQ